MSGNEFTAFWIFSFTLGTVVGALVSYNIRLLLTKKKQKLDNFNFYINSLDETLKLMVKESVDFYDKLNELKNENGRVKTILLSSGRYVKKAPDRKKIIKFSETRRQLMISRLKNLKRNCNSLKAIKPQIFPVPSDKLININKSISHLFEVDAEEGMLLFYDSVYDLLCHYERQVDL